MIKSARLTECLALKAAEALLVHDLDAFAEQRGIVGIIGSRPPESLSLGAAETDARAQPARSAGMEGRRSPSGRRSP
jgi:hypothetical protein